MAFVAHVTFDRSQLLHDVRVGMASSPKSLPPKYFYDERGSELFDEITRLPEYYPTRAERSLLQRYSREIIAASAPKTLVELGAGSADKTRYLLDAMLATDMPGMTYVPTDVSADFLERSAIRLRAQYPRLHVIPVIADFSAHFSLPAYPPPALHAFLGSTIGNFTPTSAIELLNGVRQRMARGDHFLLGADQRKDVATLERAYNDPEGVTALFNRNVLHVVNKMLGANFDTDRFEHAAIYDTSQHRIEMHLVSRGQQTVNVPEVGDIQFTDGEYILTEVSYKYDRATIAGTLDQAGLELSRWTTDASEMFAIALATART